MKRFFFATVLMILAIGVGWRYAPPQARERLLGFIGVANRLDPARIARGIREKITPDNPVARRAALAVELKQKIQEMKKSTSVGNITDHAAAPAGAAALADARAADIAKAADEAAQLVDQLERSHQGGSVSGQVVQRVLDKIMPSTQCESNKD